MLVRVQMHSIWGGIKKVFFSIFLHSPLRWPPEWKKKLVSSRAQLKKCPKIDKKWQKLKKKVGKKKNKKKISALHSPGTVCDLVKISVSKVNFWPLKWVSKVSWVIVKNGVFAILSGLEGRKPFRRVRLCNKKQNILILSLLGAFKCIFNEKMTQKVIFRLKQGRFYFKCHFTIFFVLKIFLAFIFGVFFFKFWFFFQWNNAWRDTVISTFYFVRSKRSGVSDLYKPFLLHVGINGAWFYSCYNTLFSSLYMN